MVLLKILVIFIALIIFLEDLYVQAVHWYLFPMLFVVIIGIGLYSGNTAAVVLFWSQWNILLVIVLFIVATIYASLKQGEIVNVLDGYFSLGDILLLLSLTPFFTFANYVIFFVTSMIMTITIWSVIRIIVKQTTNRVPLAGFQALFFAVIIMIPWFHPTVWTDFNSWIINKIVT